MKKTMFALTAWASVALFDPALAQSDKFVHAVQAGGTGFDRGSAITTDGADNTIITGYFQETASFGNINLTSAGMKDIFVAKSDNQGNFLWAVSAGGNSEDEGLGVATDAQGNVYVTGFFFQSASFGNTTLNASGSYDIFVAKYDANGTLQWARNDGGTSLDRGYAIAADAAGNSYVTGYFSSTATIGDSTFTSAGQDEIFIAKFDPNGAFQWARHAGGQFFDQGNGIAVDPNGNTIVTGKFSGLAFFGATQIASSRLFNTFITKLDANGTFLWTKSAGGRDDFSYGVATDGSGNIFVTGYFQQTGNFDGTFLTSAGSGDVFLAKYDENGTLQWVRQDGGSDLEMGYCVAVDGDGNAAVSGFFASTATFGDSTFTSTLKDIFVAKYDTDGNFLQAEQAGGSSIDEAYGIAFDSAGNAFLTGVFGSTATFGETERTSLGNEEIFIAKFGADGPTAVEDAVKQPNAFSLAQNYPNPFNPETTISYNLNRAGFVTLHIFDIAGKRVRSLYECKQPAGSHRLIWDGTDELGQAVSSGLYLYQLQAGKQRTSRRMLLLK